jgi:gamma-glutamyltranspeptidase/glutathione hydrolase
LSLQDLQQYQAKEREPVCGPYKAWKSARHAAAVGGVTVLQTLGMLEAVQRRAPQRDLAALRRWPPGVRAGWKPRWPCT